MNVATRAEPITGLRNAHVGEDVWVVASGPSMNYVHPAFFDGRTVVGVNEVYQQFPVTYALRKEHELAQEVIDAGIPLIVAKGDQGGDTGPPVLSGDHWVYQHRYNQSDGPIDLDVIGSDLLVVSWSTTTTAIHFAAYLGARTVIVAGHDCGLIDGSSNLAGYPLAPIPEWYAAWLAVIEEQTMQVARRVTEVYGCPVVGLNPWPSLALAGHVHSGR